MIRQYNPQRFRVLNGRRVGIVEVGQVVYLQDGIGPFGPRQPRFWQAVRRDPWIVTAWINRDCMGRVLAGGHLAEVRSLRTGRVERVADWLIVMSLELTEGGWL